MNLDSEASGEGIRVLVVDDEADIRRLVAFNLSKAGFDCRAVASGEEALAEMKAWRPVLLILDLMLPDISGPEICRRLRADPSHAGLGIIMLTARGDEYDRVQGFEVGTDDYVVKPFSPRELVHRAKALTRRALLPPSQVKEQPPLAWKDIELDPQSNEVLVRGRSVSLRPLEYRLLKMFLENPAQVLTRAQLLAGAWGVTAEIHTRTVDTHVRRLREALGDDAGIIETVYGFGYRLSE